jgi:hypothetical protein
VAAVAVGPALIVASSGGGPVDLGALGLAGGQAALAAVLAYGHSLVRPANGAKLGEAPMRAGRTLMQNLVAGALVPGTAAIASAGGDDLKTLGMAGGQAALAGVIALLHNLVSPRKAEPAEVAGPAGDVAVDGLDAASGGRPGEGAGESYDRRHGGGSGGGGYGSV